MQIYFKDKKLRELCEKSQAADRKLGAQSAKKLRSRLDDFGAHLNVSQLNVGKPHPLRGDRLGQFSVSLAGGDRIVFVPYQNPAPTLMDGTINWSQVTAIEIIFIGDYHE